MVSGIRNTMIGLAAAAALVGMADPKDLDRARRIAVDPEREQRREQDRRLREKRAHQERAWERRQRRQSYDEMRERLLRERIAKDQDDRADKYLHSAARRRRQKAALASTPQEA